MSNVKQVGHDRPEDAGKLIQRVVDEVLSASREHNAGLLKKFPSRPRRGNPKLLAGHIPEGSFLRDVFVAMKICKWAVVRYREGLAEVPERDYEAQREIKNAMKSLERRADLLSGYFNCVLLVELGVNDTQSGGVDREWNVFYPWGWGR